MPNFKQIAVAILCLLAAGSPYLMSSIGSGNVYTTTALTTATPVCGTGGTGVVSCAGGSGGAGIVTYAALSVVLSGGTTPVFVPLGGDGLGSTTEANVQMKVQPTAILRNLCVNLSAAPGVGNSLATTLRIGGANQTLTVTISGTATSGCDSTHSVTTSAGDLMDWSLVPSGTIALFTPNVMIAAEWAGSSSGGTVSSVATGCGLSGGPITTTGTIIRLPTYSARTTASEAIANGDCGGSLNFTNASAVAITIAQAGGGGNFTASWFVDYICSGAAGCTLTPATSTVNGAATLVLTQNQSARIVSDGSNYWALLGKGGGGWGVTFTEPYIISGSDVIGPVFSMTKPSDTTFAWRNQGGASIATTNGSVFLTAQGSGAYNWRIREATLPACPVTVTIGFRALMFASSELFEDLVILESGSGKFISFGPGYQRDAMSVFEWNSVTSAGSGFANLTDLGYMYNAGVLTWLRYVDNCTNRFYYISPDHINWMQYYTEASGTFIAPDRVGFGVSANTGSGATMGMTVYSFKIE